MALPVFVLQSAECWVCVRPPRSFRNAAMQWRSNGHSTHCAAAIGKQRLTEYNHRVVSASVGHHCNGRIRRKRSYSVVGGQLCSPVQVRSVCNAWCRFSSDCICSRPMPCDFTTTVFRCCAYRRDWWRRTCAFCPRLRTMLRSSSSATITTIGTTARLLSASWRLLCYSVSAVDTGRTTIQFRAFIANRSRWPLSLYRVKSTHYNIIICN